MRMARVSNHGDMITICIRADESVRAVLSPIAEDSLTIVPDQSQEARDLTHQAPPERALPIMFMIVGAMAITELLQMVRELLRQVYYGGVVIDMRSQPPSVTSDRKIPANMTFVTDRDGKTIRYTYDQLSLDVLKSLFKT
jgi:hypothetical protein